MNVSSLTGEYVRAVIRLDGNEAKEVFGWVGDIKNKIVTVQLEGEIWHTVCVHEQQILDVLPNRQMPILN